MENQLTAIGGGGIDSVATSTEDMLFLRGLRRNRFDFIFFQIDRLGANVLLATQSGGGSFTSLPRFEARKTA